MNHINLKSIKQILRYAIPNMASGLLNIVSNFIAIIFISRLGHLPLAASAIATSTFATIMTVLSTSFFATGILISHHRGGKHPDKAIGKITTNSFYCGVVLFIPTFTLLWNGGAILHLFRQSPALIALTHGYFHYAALSLIPIIIGMIVAQFFIGIGRPNFNVITTGIRLPFIVALSYAMILGKFGFPKLGLEGISASYFSIGMIYVVIISFYMLLSKTFKKYGLFENFKIDRALCRRFFNIGLPIGIQFGGEIAAMTVGVYMMGHLGVIPLAASQIVGQFSLFMIMLTLGLSQAVSILVTNAFATFNRIKMQGFIASSIAIACVIFAVAIALFTLIPKPFIQLFLHKDSASNFQLMKLTQVLLIIGMFTLFIDSLRNIYSGVLRGLHDSQTPMRMGVACLWFVSIPASYLAAFVLHGGPIGLRLGFMSGFIVATVGLAFIVKTKVAAITAEIDTKSV